MVSMLTPTTPAVSQPGTSKYGSKTDEEIKAIIEQRGLPKKGKRDDWIVRVEKHDALIDSGVLFPPTPHKQPEQPQSRVYTPPLFFSSKGANGRRRPGYVDGSLTTPSFDGASDWAQSSPL
jgi:hypothetical protein